MRAAVDGCPGNDVGWLGEGWGCCVGGSFECRAWLFGAAGVAEGCKNTRVVSHLFTTTGWVTVPSLSLAAAHTVSLLMQPARDYRDGPAM